MLAEEKTLLESLVERIALNLFRGTSSQTIGRLISRPSAIDKPQGRVAHPDEIRPIE